MPHATNDAPNSDNLVNHEFNPPGPNEESLSTRTLVTSNQHSLLPESFQLKIHVCPTHFYGLLGLLELASSDTGDRYIERPKSIVNDDDIDFLGQMINPNARHIVSSDRFITTVSGGNPLERPYFLRYSHAGTDPTNCNFTINRGDSTDNCDLPNSVDPCRTVTLTLSKCYDPLTEDDYTDAYCHLKMTASSNLNSIYILTLNMKFPDR